MDAPASAAFYATLPRPLQLACLTVLSPEDMLRFTTSKGMRQLCADDVVWRPIYDDISRRCCLQGEGYSSEARQRSQEEHQRRLQQQLEQQTSYKAKTLTHLLAYFKVEILLAERIMQDAMDAEEHDHFTGYGSPDSFGSADERGECRTPDFDDFEPTFDNWGDEEWAADDKVRRLTRLVCALTKALKY